MTAGLPPSVPTYGPPTASPPQGILYQPPTSELGRRFNAKVVASVVVPIVTLVLALMATATAWWSLSMTTTQFGSTFSVSADFHLSSVCVSGFGGGFPIIGCAPYGFGAGQLAPLGNTFGVSSALMLVGILMAILMIVFAIPAALWPRAGMVGVALGLAGAAVTLAAPLYLFLALPSAVTDPFGGGMGGTPFGSFFGSFSEPTLGTSARWGGGLGWFLSFGVFALFLVSVVLQFMASRSVASMGNVHFQRAPLVIQVSTGPPTQPGYGQANPYAYAYMAPSAPYAGAPSQVPTGYPGPPGRFCSSCGIALPFGVPVCPRCGAPVA